MGENMLQNKAFHILDSLIFVDFHMGGYFFGLVYLNRKVNLGVE